MAGAGVRLFTAGSVLTASQVNSYLMDQTIGRFADSAARDAAFGGLGEPSLSEGRVCYLDSDNKLYLYDGSTWVEIGAQIETGEVTEDKIATGAVTVNKLGTGAVTSDKILDGTILNADINASAAVALSKLASGTAGQLVVHNATGVPTATTVTGDVTITSGGVTAISSGVIVDADINASAAISLSKLATGALPTAITVASANITDLSIVNADVNASAAIAHSKLANATDGQVLLGTTTTGVITATTLSGDVTITGAGVTAIGSGVIVNADVNASAAIAHSKLANATAGQVLLGTTTTGVVTATTVSGDVTITGAGVTAISSGVIVDADINASAAIADTKLATISTAGKVSNSATTATSSNTNSAIVARDASGNFVAGKATLATADVTTVVETANIVASASTGTINIDFSTNPTVYYTSNSTADWTLNVRGTSSVTLNNTLSTGQIATVTFLATNGTTPYRPTVFQVDGSAITPKWMGGTAPSAGNASSIDAYTLAIIKTGSATFTMLASQSRFA